MLEAGRSVLVFPEGAISPGNCSLGKLHTGVVRMAMLANVPIVPIAINLNPKKIKKSVLWIDQVREECNWYLRGLYSVTYGKPLYLKGDIDNWDLVKDHLSILQTQLTEIIEQNSFAYLPVNS